MPSTITGYEYDIFISYRQKDNKHDGWVTKFVNNLKGELESTFKEEISVYFDINPHNGLLETHDVDASLKEKLKCLIFIPIISRTYCDPKSFAWEHEFKEFIKQASSDQFGLKVKLPDGNVASRILPIQIHDLDSEDKRCIEEELGGHIRGIEFIYREPGVERPLKPEDKEGSIKYNNQINKVAHAIRSIISGIKNPVYNSKTSEAPVPVKNRRLKNRIIYILSSIAILTLLFIGIFSFFHKQNIENEKSIAVIPFMNNSPDKEGTDYIVTQLQEQIINNLQQIKSFSRVLPRNSVEKYRSGMKSNPEIAEEVNVNYIIGGSAQKIGDKLALNITLTNARKDNILKTYSFNESITTPDQVFSIYSKVSQSVANYLKAEITPEEREQIEKIPTKNLMALDFYQRGKAEEFNFTLDPQNPSLQRAGLMYKKALSYDSSFAPAYAGLAHVKFYKTYNSEYYSQNFNDSCLILINKSLSINPKLPEAYYLKGVYYIMMGDPESALNEFNICLKYNPNYWQVYRDKANWIYGINCENGDYVEAIVNLRKAISLNHGKERAGLIRDLGGLYAFGAGFIELAQKSYKEALSVDNDSSGYFSALSSLSDLSQNLVEKEKFVRKWLTSDRENVDALFSFGFLLIQKGDSKAALQCYEKYAELILNAKQLGGGGMHRIAYAYWLNGNKKQSDFWFNKQKMLDLTTIRNNRYNGSIAPLSYYDLACVYSFEEKKDSAYMYLRKIDEMKVFPAWWILFIKIDPLLDNLRKDKEFQELVERLDTKYQAEHERVRKWLEENKML